MYDIVVFTLDGCNHCSDLKNLLKKNDYIFTEIEITNNEDIWNQVVNQTNHNVVPTVFLKKKNSDKGPIYIPGKDFNSSEELVDKIKKYF